MEEEVESEETVFADPEGLDNVSSNPGITKDELEALEELLKKTKSFVAERAKDESRTIDLDNIRDLMRAAIELRNAEDDTVEDDTVFAPPEGLDSVTVVEEKVTGPSKLGEVHEIDEIDKIDIFKGGGLREKTQGIAKRLMDATKKKKQKKKLEGDFGEKKGDESKTRKGEEDYTPKKEKKGDDKRKGAEKDGAEGTLAETPGHGRVDY